MDQQKVQNSLRVCLARLRACTRDKRFETILSDHADVRHTFAFGIVLDGLACVRVCVVQCPHKYGHWPWLSPFTFRWAPGTVWPFVSPFLL